ncbi:NAD(P)-binding protein [Exidia glandulosa HHB12029]|uniref:NAD(P)-binding protein n=1 Tax=Exidia glandulosa HHB12029 TaxID=1314781 RepID=A0A165P2Z9_EXIGL|nr:NAD(P)-binding protein [Exidia glandulosa HHB12029]
MSPTVLITGASRGMGLATAEQLLQDGATVIAVQRSVTDDLKVLEKKFPGKLQIVKGDSTKESDIAATLSATPSLDVVILNAGVSLPLGRLSQIDIQDVRNTYEINVFSVIKFIQAALPKLRASKGRAILVSSAAGEFGIQGLGSYSSSKAALNQVSRTFAAEEPDVTVIAIHSGAVNTGMSEANAKEAPKHMDAATVALLTDNLIEPEVSASALSKLALRAPKDYTEKYLYYTDPLITSL